MKSGPPGLYQFHNSYIFVDIPVVVVMKVEQMVG